MNPRSVVLIAGLSLVILHRVDGGEVVVAPEHITSMHSKAPTSAQNKLVTPDARCIVCQRQPRLTVAL